MKTIPRARMITRSELARSKRVLPQSLVKAAGLLSDRKKALENHIRKIRREWDKAR